MDKADCIVVGAGVIGLAVARALALSGREVIVVEQHPSIGMETSSRNSEVIHAGLYYPTGSLKAKLCVAGREMLYQYCAERAVPYKRCGKLVVAASESQLMQLAKIHAVAHANGCGDVSMLNAQEAQVLEPELSCIAAMHSPGTGIIDTHAYMLSLQADAEHAGAVFAFDSSVSSGSVDGDSVVLNISAGDGTETAIRANTVINCGGLWAPQLARQIQGLDTQTIPDAYFAKGNYYSLSGKAPFSRLIYPVPEPGGLGIHLTLDMGGQARFGPDVEWIDAVNGAINYTVDPRRADAFYKEIRAYWPALEDGALHPAYAGVRPKIVPRGAAAADFLFASHGCKQYLGLYGIESPGLTASLAIAAHAVQLLQGTAG